MLPRTLMLTVLFASIQLQKQPQPSTENPAKRLRIKQIVIQGARVFTPEELRKQLQSIGESNFFNSLAGRDLFNRERVLYDLQRLRQFLAERGYVAAYVSE